jgi:DNA-directed RNA polymerase subunit RPC12/RpoP
VTPKNEEEDDPVLRSLEQAPLDDEAEYVCLVDGTEFLSKPGEQACPKCGSRNVASTATSEKLRRLLAHPSPKAVLAYHHAAVRALAKVEAEAQREPGGRLAPTRQWPLHLESDMGDAIDLALEQLAGSPCVVMLRMKASAIKTMPMPAPPGAPPQLNVFVTDDCYQFQSENQRRVGNGWEFRLRERNPKNELVTILLTVRTDEILMVRAISALGGGLSST